MKQGRLRGTLLATSSALALVVGMEGAAQATPPPCAVNNTFAGLPNTTTINCISFNDGASHTGDVTNASNGTITASHPYAPVNPGTSTGISVVRSGTTLNGNIINNGSISAPQDGINVGGGATTGGIQGAGASVVGSITNNGSITASRGIELSKSSALTGNLINNGTINYVDSGINLNATALTAGTVTGSIINNGTVSGTGGGIGVQHYTVTGSFTNALNGTITATAAFAGMELSFGSVQGSFTNNGTLNVHGTNDDGSGMYVDGASVGGSFSNTGTINGDAGMGIQHGGGLPGIVTGNFSNSGTINAAFDTGMAVYSATIGGAVTNSGSIKAADYGILVLNFTGAVAGASVAGGISNSGTITSTTAGFAGIAVAGGAVISNGITNTASGNIHAQGPGILLTNQTAFGTGVGTPTVAGGITNQGTITGHTGIAVTNGGIVSGGITNTGTLTGSGGSAIDVSGEGAATTINQEAGTITGNILLSSLGDTVNVTGGAIAGNIVGTGASGTVNFALGAGNTFTYSNTISGVSAVNVNSGTFFDNNSISATTVSVNGGTLAPGQPGTPGTLAITGSLVFSTAATYLVTLTPPVASRTNVTGPASVAGTVRVAAQPGSYSFGTTYTILNATTGVTGTFGGVTSSSSVTGTLSYDAHDVFLTIAPNLLTLQLPPGAPTNVRNVAGAIDSFNSSGGTIPGGFQSLYGLTPQQLVNALTQLSGEAGTGAQASGFQLMNSFMALLTGPAGGSGEGGGPAMPFAPERAQAFPSDVALAYASVLKAPPKAVPHWTTWAAAFGGTNSTSGDPTGVGSHDMTAHTGAVAAGADYHVSPDTIVGFSLAGGGSSWGLSAGLGGGRSDAFLAGLYGSKRWDQAYLSGALTYSSYWMSTNRTVTVFGPDSLNASFNAQNLGGRLEGGYAAWSMPFRVIPYAAVQAQSFHAPAYGETGSLGAPDPSALSFAAQTATVVRSELGSRFDQIFAQPDGGSLDLFGRAAWAHDWQSNPNLTATFIGLPAATFVVNGAAPPKDLALLTAGAERRWRSGWSVMGKFDGEFGQRSQTYTGTAKVSYTW